MCFGVDFYDVVVLWMCCCGVGVCDIFLFCFVCELIGVVGCFVELCGIVD